jgi:hypothetical protein
MSASSSSRSGEAVFARYAYPPNDLGHCGPPGAEVLLASGASGLGHSELRQRAPHFDGAWLYLRRLSIAAGIDDPLDARVVSAYWLGGDLLDTLEAGQLEASVRIGFGGQPGVLDRLAQTPDAASAGATHAFHVFVVYPWVGLLGGGSDVPRSVLDSCRVRWGRVEALDGETAEVRSQPLTWDGTALGLGDERLETVRWSQGRHAFVPGLGRGDLVSMHWDWVCDRLDDGQLATLADRTQRQLTSTNVWLARQSERSFA